MAQGLGGLDDRPDKGREPETDQIEVVNAHLHSPPEHLGSSSGGTGSWLDSQDLERPVAKIWKRWGESNRSGRRRSSSPPTRSWRTRSAVAGCSWTRRKTPGSVHRRETMPATASTMITRSSANTSSNRPPSPSQARPARRSKGEFGRRGHVAGNGSSLRVLDPGQGHAGSRRSRPRTRCAAGGRAGHGSMRIRSSPIATAVSQVGFDVHRNVDLRNGWTTDRPLRPGRTTRLRGRRRCCSYRWHQGEAGCIP